MFPQRHRILVGGGGFRGVLVAGGNPFMEMRRLSSILKQQPHQTVLYLKAVEEFTVLVVLEVDVEFLVPHDTAVANDIDQFEKQRVTHQIVDQTNGAVQVGEGPCLAVRVRDVQAGDGGVDDLIVGFGNGPSEFLLVVSSNKRHWNSRICQDVKEARPNR